MGFKIVIQWMDDIKVEPPGSWDLFAFWALMTYSCLALIISISCLYYQRFYEPLRLKNTGKLSAALCFSVLHVWSLYVANEQDTTVRNWANQDCIFWNYWLPYAISLTAWFSFMNERILNYGLVLSSIKIEKDMQRTALKIVLIVILDAPMIVACLLGSVLKLSFVNSETNSCSSSIVFQLCILISVILQYIAMFSFNSMFNKQIRLGTYLNEYEALRQCLLVGASCMIVFLIIHFGGLQVYSVWRTIQVLSLCINYCFCFLRLVLFTLLKAINGNADYQNSLKIILASQSKDCSEYTMEDIINASDSHTESIRKDFFNFCYGHIITVNYEIPKKANTNPPISENITTNIKEVKQFSSITLLDCFNELEKIDHASDLKSRKQQYFNLLNKFFIQSTLNFDYPDTKSEIAAKNKQSETFPEKLWFPVSVIDKLQECLIEASKEVEEDAQETNMLLNLQLFSVTLKGYIFSVLKSRFWVSYKGHRLKTFAKPRSFHHKLLYESNILKKESSQLPEGNDVEEIALERTKKKGGTTENKTHQFFQTKPDKIVISNY